MNLTEHQQRIGSRIAAHASVAGIPVIVEADVPNVVSEVQKSLAQHALNIVVASGAGESASTNALAVTLAERFVVTIAHGIRGGTQSPVQLLAALLPWLHGYPAADAAGAPRYQVRRHDPLPDDGPISGHQITLEVPVGIRFQA